MNSAPLNGDDSFFASRLTLRQPSTRRRIIGLTAFLLTLSSLGLAAARYAPSEPGNDASPQQGSASGTDQESALPVSVDRLSLQPTYQQQRRFTGVIKPRRQAQLAFQRTAELIEVVEDQGAVVQQQQVLARIDTRSLDAERLQVLAELKQARSILSERRAGPRQEAIDAQSAMVDDLANQVARFTSLEKRQAGLQERQAVAQDVYEETVFELASRRARLEAARQKLEEMNTGTRTEQIEAQEAIVAQLEAKRDQVDVQLIHSTLTAPFAGWITRRHLDEGAIVTAGQPVLTLVEEEPWEAWIGVPPEWAADMQADQSVELEVGGELVAGRVQSVLTDLDAATRTRTVVVSLPTTSGGKLVPGQVARLAVPQTVHQSGYWIPMAALQRHTKGLWTLLIAEPSSRDGQAEVRASARIVEVLHIEGERAFVRGTLHDGELYIAAGPHRLAAGQLLQPLLTH